MSKPKKSKTRVAVYIRVGGSGDVETTAEKQKTHFAALADKHEDWELAGFYADLGADSRKQPNLARLLADCRAGRIDLVVTKSASRISRSMPILMDTVRKLAYSKPPIGMYFEDTDLNTLDKNSYMLLTMFEVMSVDDGGAKQNAPCSLAKYLQLREKTTPQKKSIKSKEDENHE